MAKTIASLLDGRDNNFNLIRFLAASAVILDHSFTLVAPEHRANTPVEVETLRIGRLAVDVFFIVSGFLVTRSVLKRPTLVEYGVSRCLRLFPALLVACIFIAFILGPTVSLASVADYFTDPRTWIYVPLTASLVTHSLTLPGVFDGLPESGVVDPPLWTLRYEAICYVLLALFAVLGALATKRRGLVTVALVFVTYLFVTFATSWRQDVPAIDSAARFVLAFFIGGTLYLLADRIRLHLGVALGLAAVAAALYGTPACEALFRVALAYGVLWFALVPAGVIRRFNLMGDYSYGLYILCFPIQQTFVLLDPAIGPVALFVCSFPAVLAFAVLSWHFVEHPALSQKVRAGERAEAFFEAMRLRFAPRVSAASPRQPMAKCG